MQVNRRILYTSALSTGVVADAAQTTAFLARVVTNGTTLDATHISAYKALINGLVGDGVFTKLDALWLATQDEPTFRLNLVQNLYNLTTTGVPVPTYTNDRGELFAGGGFYSTNFNPFTATTPKYLQDDAHVSVWSNTTGDDPSASGPIGTFTGSGHLSTSANGSVSGNNFQINDTTNSTVEHTSGGKGLYVTTRTGSSQRDGYWGLSGTLTHVITDSATASTGVPNDTLFMSGLNGFSSFGKQCSSFSIGGGLTSTDATNLYNRVQTYMTSIGN